MNAQSGYQWSLDEAQVKKMLEKEKSLSEIAREFNVTPQAVSRFLQRRGWIPAGRQNKG